MTQIARTQPTLSPSHARVEQSGRSLAAAAPASAPRAPLQASTGASNLRIPDWVKDAVFYQVFPERFANGDTSNDPAGTQPWGTPPTNFGFQGGDLQGVDQRVAYMQQLGVNALYLNPIFESASNHKYDVADYYHVDDNFGGDAAFDKLSKDLHANGMKVILDGVFNHTSNENAWFKDVVEKGPESKYWSWYNVQHFPIKTWTDEHGVLRSNDYKGWGTPDLGGPYATLPELQNMNPEVIKQLVTGDDSVVRHWLKDGKIDGWRMDVADEVEPDFWRQVHSTVKADNPDAYLVAENWHDASSYLEGDQFDGSMNYQYFTFPSVDFFAKKSINADQFAQRLQNGYSSEARFGAFNILDSHDTPRFITQAGGDWYRQRPAAIFQMTYVGAPVVYYGDELGMEGDKDPDSRRAMNWSLAPVGDAKHGASMPNTFPTASSENGDALDAKQRAGELFGLYQSLIRTRKDVPALRRGDFDVIATNNADAVISYRRSLAGDARDAVVTLNNSVVGHDHVRVPMGGFAPDGTAYTDTLSGAHYTVNNGSVTLPHLDGNFGAVLVRDA